MIRLGRRRGAALETVQGKIRLGFCRLMVVGDFRTCNWRRRATDNGLRCDSRSEMVGRPDLCIACGQALN